MNKQYLIYFLYLFSRYKVIIKIIEGFKCYILVFKFSLIAYLYYFDIIISKDINSIKQLMTFRSEDMAHYQLIIPRQNAYNTINEFGLYDLVHIVDNGQLINRPFYPQIKRCDQLLSKVQLIIQKLKKEGISFDQYDEDQSLFIEKLYFMWAQEQRQLGIQAIKMLDKVENDILSQFKRFKDIEDRLEKMKFNRRQYLQKIACYQTIDSFFGQSTYKRQSQQYYINNVSNAQRMSGVSYIVGVIPNQSILRLSKMIYRVSRGYACIKMMDQFQFAPLRQLQQKIILVIYPSSDSAVLQKKIQRVVQSFCSNHFNFSKIQLNTKQTLQKFRKEFSQVLNMEQLNKKEMKQYLSTIKNIKYIQSWRIFLWKQKVIYETLNRFQLRDQIVWGQIYCPVNKIQKLSLRLSKMSPSPSLHEMDLGNPPTSFNTNCYTLIAQQITNTYGVPRYKQINPSILTTVTFPFFFGVMFGDIAHGLILFIFGIFLVFNNPMIKKSALKILSELRYIILMMGFFAFYCGWVYNDFLGMNLNLMGSCYAPQPQPDEKEPTKQFIITPEDSECIYPFGIDPIWGRSKNNLQYVNSLKMKISVIIAIVHMTVGIIIKAFNSRFFKKKLDFYFQFIPQITFMVILFGYMDFLIIFKWLKFFGDEKDGQRWAPSIITTMMNIGLKMGKTTSLPDGGSNMWGQRGNTSQDTLQLFILLIAFLCVPVMLLPKPIIQIKKMNLKKKEKNPLLISEDQELQSQISLSRKLNPSKDELTVKSSEDRDRHQHEQQPNQIFVHQLIQTIQFVLGAISNTASYLRLWALSLAHSQLALVFFNKTLQNGFGPAAYLAPPIMVIGFYYLCWITFGILMCMDSMQCFLHSLRLHWVQFQNKFYKGDGYRYQPLSYKKYIMELKGK